MTASVLIAPDKFKGTLSAQEVAEALGVGFASKANVRLMPLADGGDGSIEAIAAAGFEVIELDSSIPSATPEPAHIAHRDDVYFIEATEFCGLRHVAGRLDPLSANSLGVGLAVRAALDLGAHTIVLGVGGTASTDGGVGFLVGLGAKFSTETGESIPLGGGGLPTLSSVDFSGIDPRLETTKIILASDVDSPLLGELGAARSFSPQKGANPLQVEVLEQGISRLVKVLREGPELWGKRTREVVEIPGAGAGGGLGFAALLIGARRVSGADYILDVLDIDGALQHCDLVVTGEGSLDQQSLAGKLPIVLAARARARNIPVVAVVGTCRMSKEEYLATGISKVYTLDEMDPRCATDSKLSLKLLAQIGEKIGHAL